MHENYKVCKQLIKSMTKHVIINHKMPFCKRGQYKYKLDYSRWYTIVNTRFLDEMLLHILYITWSKHLQSLKLLHATI